jgi:hypothetical protein
MASAETQSTQSEPGSSTNTGSTGGGSGSGGTVAGGGTVVTAPDKANQPKPEDPSLTQTPTLADQIASNFAALSSLLGTTDQTGGGAYPVPVPVAAPAKSSLTVWLIVGGAAIAIYFIFFRKKGAHNGNGE